MKSFSGILISCALLSVCPVSSNFVATEKPASLTVVEGATAIFHCHVNQQVRESYDIAWFSESRNAFLSKNAALRHPDTDVRNRYSITRTFGHRFDLRIENVKVSDAGKFVCMFAYQDNPLQKVYYNNAGPAADLVVWTAPTVGSPDCLINTLSNGDVEFVCVSDGGNPTPSLNLYADDIRLQIKPEANGHNVYLRITLTEAYRGVNLKCMLDSKALQSTKACSLTPLPPVVRITPKIAKVTENSEIKFNCSSHGLDNPTYQWLATTKLIINKRFSSDAKLVTLTIREAHLADNGSKIMCIATGANGDKVASEEAILMVEERIGPRITEIATQKLTTVDPSATKLHFLPAKPRAKHTAMDFLQNNVLILAVCVAGIFIVLLSMVAIVIVCKRKRKSYNVNDNVDDDVLVDNSTYAHYDKFDKRTIYTNTVSGTDKVTDEAKQELVNGSPLVSPAASPTRSQPTSPKQSPKLTSKTSPSLSIERTPTTSTTSGPTNQQSIPRYAKPMKGSKSTTIHPLPAYAMPIKRDFHLSLEDVTGQNLPNDSPNPISDSQSNRNNHKNEYAELTNVLSPTKNNIKSNKYEEILPSPAAVDPRNLNVEGLKYADLEINKQSSSQIRSDVSMKTQYAQLANPNDAIGNI